MKVFGRDEVPANVITAWHTANSWTNSNTDSIRIEPKTFENVIEEDATFHTITASASLLCDDFTKEGLGTMF